LFVVKPCPHCRRKVRLSPKTARKRRQSPNSATAALFCDSVDRALDEFVKDDESRLISYLSVDFNLISILFHILFIFIGILSFLSRIYLEYDIIITVPALVLII